MAKVVQDAKLTTRAARAGLAEGIHYRSIDPDVHLVYRKGKRGGVWGARWYLGNGLYRREKLGTADDIIAAGNLDFAAAVNAARKQVSEWRREAAARAAGPVATVRSAVEVYVAARDARDSARAGRPVKSDARRLHLHVLSNEKLAETEIFRLTEDALKEWRSSLGGAPSSRQRTTNDFKAALTEAAVDAATREMIAKGLKRPRGEVTGPVARDNQILGIDEVRRLVAAAKATGDYDLFLMVALLAATGARFGQVARLRVMDVQASRLMMPASRKGRGDDVDSKPPIPVPIGLDISTALIPATRGRRATEPLLERWRHIQTGPMEWKRDRRGPWTTPSELTRLFRAVAEAAGLPGVIPYALRHSSIGQKISANQPIPLIAKLHDTSVAMIEKHYGYWITTALERLVAEAVVPIILADDDDNVVPFERQEA